MVQTLLAPIKRLFKKKELDICEQDTSNITVFTLYGPDAELHDRIQGAQGHFHLIHPQIQRAVEEQQEFKIDIGISRYNFYCLDKIINTCFAVFSGTAPIKRRFDIFPVQTVAIRFRKYIKQLKEDLKIQNRVHLKYTDESVKALLNSLQEEVRKNPLKERDLIRLFSIICEKTFIGPATIVMDPYHRCNTNCRHCWVHTPMVTHTPEFLDRKINMKLFRSIVDDAASLQSDLIILQGDGEPLMYEHTLDMLRYIRKKGIEAMVFTNGYLLTKDRARAIIDIGVKEVYCSLPAGTKQAYQRVCPMHSNDDFFDTIVTNLKAFMQMRKRMGKEHPKLVMTHVMHSENYEDLLPMAELDAELGVDAVRFYLIRLDDNIKDLKLSKEQMMKMYEDVDKAEKILRRHGCHFIDNVRFQSEHYDEATGSWCEDVFLKEGCTIGYFFCLIPALTDLSLCCHLRTIGWLNKVRFKDLWLSPEYERYRRQAKYMQYNKDVTFMNGVKLYDEHCTHCDNHQTLIFNIQDLKRLGWYKYLNV